MRRGRRGRGRPELGLNAEINVINLVDVALVLLVIFIITAPILQGGIEVAVPKTDVGPLNPTDDPFFVTVTRQGEIYIESTLTTVEEFQRSFPQLVAAGSIDRVYLRADSLAMYGPVLKVMATMANVGVPWALVGEPFTGR
jgi:biopolymer transport protein ExbD/biopolymer transport protein TolR